MPPARGLRPVFLIALSVPNYYSLRLIESAILSFEKISQRMQF
jgi:hypothetical protein